MNRPNPDSQAGRLLHLLESAQGAKVSLLDILNLRISQYSARIFELRHTFGFRIENGCEPGRPDHRWFRLLPPSGPREHPGAPTNLQQNGPRLFDVESHRDLG